VLRTNVFSVIPGKNANISVKEQQGGSIMADSGTVFDMNNSTVTTCTAKDYEQDYCVPINFLAYGDIYSGYFINPIFTGFDDGVHHAPDQTIIYGNQVTLITGSKYQRVKEDRSTYVVRKDMLKVDDERKVVIEENDSLVVKGDAERYVLGMLEELNVGPKWINEVSEWIDVKGKEVIQIGVASVSINAVKSEIFVGSLDIGLGHTQAVLFGDRKKIVKLRQGLVDVQQKVGKLESAALAAQTGGPFIHAIIIMHV
jgi:hypothetical protein